MKRAWILTASLALSMCMAACTDESLTPLDGKGTSSSSGDASTSSGSTSSGMDAPIREVFVRNPWGMPANNLLVDGDFEFSITTSEGQYGWLLIDETGGATLALNTETGGLCKSGLKCGVAPAKTLLFGRGTAAANLAPMRATLYAKPTDPPAEGSDPAKTCKAAMDAYAIDCDSFDVLAHFTSIGAPGADGYCEFGVDVPGRNSPVCIYATMKKPAIVDACTLLPSGAPPDSPTPHALTKGTEQMLAVRRLVRSRMPFAAPLREADR